MENNNTHNQESINEKSEETRPLSSYENYLNSSQQFGKDPNDVTSPSQAHCLKTTVPQNIARQCIAGKHTPTRNSLRHSRMIVMNRNGRVPSKYLPAIIRHHKFVKLIVYLLIILGIVLCFTSFCLLIWSPNLRRRDNPFWGAVPVLCSGVAAAVLICCCPKEYPGRRLGFYFYSVKYISITTSVAAIIILIAMCFFATVHLLMLGTASCAPSSLLNSTCDCKVNSTETSYFIHSYHYEDLTCAQVHGILKSLIMFSFVNYALIIILESSYLYLHWSSRYKYLYYRVPMKEMKEINHHSANDGR